MDKLKLRYLIREAIENVANISSKFSVGDKVTTVDGDTANVTMAEHPFYTVVAPALVMRTWNNITQNYDLYKNDISLLTDESSLFDGLEDQILLYETKSKNIKITYRC